MKKVSGVSSFVSRFNATGKGATAQKKLAAKDPATPSFDGKTNKGLRWWRHPIARWADEASPRVSAKASHASRPPGSSVPPLSGSPKPALRQHRVLAIDADKVSVSILLNGRPFGHLILGQAVKVDPVEAN